MIAFKRILVPTDFSETSDAAIRYAVELTRGFNSALHVLHVVERNSQYDEGMEFPLGLMEGLQNSARERLNKVLTEEEKAVVRPEVVLRVGNPFLEIIGCAKEHDIDLIVMGTHGRGFVTHMLMGSVAEKVVRKAPCPVLTVRDTRHEFVLREEVEKVSVRAAH